MQQTQKFDEIIQNLEIPKNAFIDNKETKAVSGQEFDNISPVNGNIIGKIPACDAIDVDIAVKAARKNFEDGNWKNLSAKKRKKILLKLADIIEDNSDTLAYLETIDMGKTITNSRENDIPASIETIRWYAESIDKIYDQIAPFHPKRIALINREPIGVVAAVTPWNFPLLMACCKIAPALACGNSVILKPAEQSSLSAMMLAKFAVQAGLPDNTLQVVTGFGETAGQRLGRHPLVDAISFTGSTQIGKLFFKYAGESTIKHISLECGGKSPNIVFDDYEDIKYAAEQSAKAAFTNNGQVCCAPTRLFIQDNIYDEFIREIVKAANKMYPDNPLKKNSKNGAIVDQSQTHMILQYIDSGEKQGAQIITGGKQIFSNTGGFYVEPTIFENVDNNMKIATDEIFGPVLVVFRFKDEEQVIKMANDTIYGLQAYIWSDDINKIHRIARKIKTGTVIANGIGGSDITTPFGGFKQSGIARDNSLHAIEKYTQLKTTIINLKK